MDRIVVGVDGSAAGEAALRWALREASVRQATLVAVHTWTFPYLADLAYLANHGVDHQELAAEANDRLAEALAAAGPIPSGVTVEELVCEGSPAGVLIDAAHDATMLVVGSRGLGGFGGLLLGSVSQQCAHHAPCPVVIVRSGTTTSAA
ncbi:MAG TPA: universal stress protein [Acidimicrobiales bacterium]|nr:universal stress protein [Acidimicrobiales bacterium]